MKIMILGDTHGNTREAIRMVENAKTLGINVILQVGDFGLWDHAVDGIEYLDDLNAVLRESNIDLMFLDGNHENHDRLDWYKKNNPKMKQGQVYIRSNILYLPRGIRWKYDGKMFMAVGGAVSIDKAFRTKGKSWWPGEQLTEPQLAGIIKHHENSPGKVDYLLTHDCPTNAPFGSRLKPDFESQIHRQRMDRLGKAIKPTLWLHGHMHSRYDYAFPDYDAHTRVYGLECDGMRNNWGVLDTMDDSFRWAEWYADTLKVKRVMAQMEIDDDF